MRRVEIFDTTLRDGAQASKISFTSADKLAVARVLDRVGVTYIEAGNPASNPKDEAFFRDAARMRLENAQLVSFGSTRHRAREAKDDPLCQKLLAAHSGITVLFGKSSAFQAQAVLGADEAENLQMIADTVRFFNQHGVTVFYDAEHFFDGYKADPDYTLRTLEAAHEAGAQRLILCDTNGGTFPWEIEKITEAVVSRFGAQIGIHCHDDMGCAVACSLAAVRAGVIQVQGTFLGFGERCGNANLSALIPSLQLKMSISCIPADSMKQLTQAAREIAEIANVVLSGALPYVGRGAFAHKGGMHIDAVGKCPASFEHLDPVLVGNEREFLLSEQSGRSSLLAKIRQIAPFLQKESAETGALMQLLKTQEYEGYQYETANASFELAVLKHLGLFIAPYRIEQFKIAGDQPHAPHCKLSSALVKVRVGERTEMTADEGEGPVHALDRALRKALESFYPAVCQIRLVDYKVRVLEPAKATEARVRVLIETTDGITSWSTVGVSPDIISASFMALTDSIDYQLYRTGMGLCSAEAL